MAARKHRPVLYEIAKFGKRAPALRPTSPQSPARSEEPSEEKPRDDAPPRPPAVQLPHATPPRPAAATTKPSEHMDEPATPSANAASSSDLESVGIAQAAETLPFAAMRVTLAGPWLAVAVAATLLALLVAFEAGRRVGSSSAQPSGAPLDVVTPPATRDPGPESDAARPQRENPAPAAKPAETASPVQTPQAEPAANAPWKPPPAQLRSGYHYVVVQHFPRSAAVEADRAAEFLSRAGLKVAITRGDDTRLLIDDPHLIDQDDKRAANAERTRSETLRATVRKLGKEYFSVERKYDFGDAYLLKAP